MPKIFSTLTFELPENIISRIFWHCDAQTICMAKSVNHDWMQSISTMATRKTLFNSLIQKCNYFTDISFDEFSFVPLKGGLTNTSFKITAKNQMYATRIPGNKTEDFIDRKNEYKNAVIASELKINAEIVFYDIETGGQITVFLPNPMTMTSELIKSDSYLDAAMKTLKSIHSSTKPFANDIDIFARNESMLRIVISKFPDYEDKYKQIKTDMITIKEVIDLLNLSKHPCHNDTTHTNFLFSREHMYLIDWEYSGNNFPIWDLVCLAMESECTQTDINKMVALYDGAPSQEKVHLINLLAPVYQYWGALWASVQISNDNIKDDIQHLQLLESTYMERCKSALTQPEFLSALQAFKPEPAESAKEIITTQLSQVPTQLFFNAYANQQVHRNAHNPNITCSLRF